MDVVIGQHNLMLLQEALQEHGLANNCSAEAAQSALMRNMTLANATESSFGSIHNNTYSNFSSINEHLPPCDISFVADPNLLASFGNETPFFNGTYAIVDQYDTSRYYIKRPHDMLHPSGINPGLSSQA